LVESPQKKKRADIKTPAFSAFVCLICLFGNLGAIGVVGPDEPRYAWIARAMATTGDWVTPRLYGQPWFEKPILYYWAAALGFRLHLPAEAALRLPSAFAALAAAIAIGWLAWKHYAPVARSLGHPALLAPLLFSTTVATIGFSRAATPDMLFSASMALAMASAATIFRRSGLLRSAEVAPGSKSLDALPILLFGAFLGLAVLAKGPAAILLASGAVLLWALARKCWRAVFRLAHPYAVGAFCLVAIPWYAVCALRNPDFIHVFIFQHNFERYLTPIFQHRQPFWFFGPITLLAILPWTVLLWPVGQEGLRLWRDKSWADSPGFFFACWAVFPVLFFSFSQSKLPGYILPAVPALALLCAVALSRIVALHADAQRASISRVAVALACTWLLLGITAAIWTHRLPPPERDAIGRSISIAAILAIGSGLGLLFFALRRRAMLIGLSLLFVTLLVEVAGLGILPGLDPFISARWHARLLQNDRHADRVFTYHLSRSWIYGLAFYMGRELPEWSPSDPDPALVLSTPAGLEEIRKLHRFLGNLEETYQGILYVPIEPTPR
jgi:4-amino-4-deoxy-L-arabinose transferase-like glycosyltransferase